MSEYVNVAVDAMGGDNAPGEIIKGTVDALNAYRQLRVMLVGREEIVKEELAKYTYPERDQEEKGFFYCKGTAAGQGRKMRCLCIRRQHRRHPGRRSADRRPDPRH